MKHLCACLLVLGALPPLLASNSLHEARLRWLHGDYAEARILYESILKKEQENATAAIGLSHVLQSVGAHEKVLSVLDSALKTNSENADLLARQADVLFFHGNWDQAEKTANAALKVRQDHFLARWVRACVYRNRGDLDKANSEFRWFVRVYTSRNDADKDVKNPEDLLLIGLAGSENARWNSLSDQFQFILTDIFGDALRYEKEFWPAEYEAGMLLLEKYNRGEAIAAFNKALVINPNAAVALVGKGRASLQRFEIAEAESFAEHALRINPHLPESRNLRADCYMAIGDVTQALRELEQSREINPRNEETLARIAVCLLFQHKQGEFDKLVAEVKSRDTKPGIFYYVLAEGLENQRRYDEAEKFYKKSAGLWPMLPAPKSNLGLLYMRIGREKEARPLLEKAFEADSFNVRVANTLKVLRHLDTYTTLKTTHFELRFDPGADRELGKVMAKYLEAIYTQLVKKFHYEPAGPLLVEVFNTHEMFSGRVIAIPDLHTIGACTGPVVAMVSPRAKDLADKGMRHPFNWARVLRHELVHIFNLEQTHFQIPIWFTEGLAVSNEGYPRTQLWNQLLQERVSSGHVMNLTNIDLSFIRPKSENDRAMAYCQSHLYVQYLQEKYGSEAVNTLLAAYQKNFDTKQAIMRVCKQSVAEFEKGYQEYVYGVAKSLKGNFAIKQPSLVELQEAHEKDPNEPDIAAQLAEQFLNRGRNKEARKMADRVLTQKKSHPLASYVKAKLLLGAGDDDAARQVLELALDRNHPEPKVLEALGNLCLENNDLVRAEHIFHLGHQCQPYDHRWLTFLERTFALAGDKVKQINVLKELVPTDADNIDARKKLARILDDEGRYLEAEQYARQALEIDVLDGEAERALGDALFGLKRSEEAIEVYNLVLEINDKADTARVKLAQAYLDTGNKPKAEVEIIKILMRDPENTEAKRLQKSLND